MGIFGKSQSVDETDPDNHAQPHEDEEGLVRTVDWSEEEEKKAKRKSVSTLQFL